MPHRLKGQKLIDHIFTQGKSVFVFPIKAVFLINPNTESNEKFSFGVSVSKRNFKKAVDRNRIKRQMREAIKLNSINKEINCSVMFIYVDKSFQDYKVIKKSVAIILKKIDKKNIQ